MKNVRIAMEGPKLDDTECRAVIRQACTSFCSGLEKQIFQLDKCRIVLEKNRSHISVSVCGVMFGCMHFCFCF